MNMGIDFNLALESLPYLLSGAGITLAIVLSALCVGAILGMIIAFSQVFGGRTIQRILDVYVNFFRSQPELLLLWLFWLGLPEIGIKVGPFGAALLAYGLRSAAYQSQIFRGSIQAISISQVLAARSMGLNLFKTIIHILLPQVLRLSIPGFTNEYSIVLKDSAVAYSIGLAELVTRGGFIIERTFDPATIYLTIAGIYLCLTYGGVKVLHISESKFKIPGYK
jgi:polar amino acid transport system permease protein